LDDSTPSFQQVDNFFNTEDALWAPGKEETKTLIITNNTNIPQYILFFSLNKDDPTLVSQAMHITILNSNKDILYSNALFAFINRGEMKLNKTIEPNSVEKLFFNIKMYETAGNKYQNSYIHFDLGIDLLDPKDYIEPTFLPCGADLPPPVSQLTLGRIDSDQILLEWSKEYDDENNNNTKELVTGHSILYSINESMTPFSQFYVGKTNQFIVKNLDLVNNRYYFKVKTINDCTEGKWSSVISIGIEPTPPSSPTPSMISLSVSANPTISDVLHLSSTPSQETTSNHTNPIQTVTMGQIKIDEQKNDLAIGQIQGIKTKKCRIIWWQILIIQTVSVFFIMFYNYRFKKTKKSIASLTSILLYIVYLIINPCLTTKLGLIIINEPWYLNYFWILMFIVLINIIFLNKAWKQKYIQKFFILNHDKKKQTNNN